MTFYIKDVVKRIKNRRLELNYSYQDLAEKSGISKSTLQRYETGTIEDIPLDKFNKIAEALDTTPEFLMGWIEKKEKTIIVHEFTNATEALKFILEQPVLMAYGGYDLEKMTNEELIDLANDILLTIKISTERRKNK